MTARPRRARGRAGRRARAGCRRGLRARPARVRPGGPRPPRRGRRARARTRPRRPRGAGASRGCGRPRRPPCATRRAPAAGRLPLPRAGRCRARGSGCRPSAPGGRPARTRRCGTGARVWGGRAARWGAAGRPPSDGQLLATLRAAALQRDAAGARAHADTEPVRAGALALLGLVGALHGVRTGSETAGQSSVPASRTGPSTCGAQACAQRPPRNSPRFATCPGDPPERSGFRPIAVDIVAAPAAQFGWAGPLSSFAELPRPRGGASLPVTDDPDHTWSRIEVELRQRVPADTYEIWLAPLRPVSIEGSEVVVEAPRELRAWVAQRFARVLQASATAVLGAGAVVRVRGGEEGPPALAGRARRRGQAEPATPAEEPANGLNPKYSFEQFVIGDANRFAHAAALAVAELPGQAYNPLFIYGPPGVGKTHLLHSIGNYVAVCGGGLSVRYTTVETFTNQFIAAISGGSMDRFKGRFRRNDVLLIDDVQFLASKAKTEEEFFHTFNALYEAGSQLVLTSDRMPRDLEALEDRLRERFESGLVTAIRPPDLPTRLTVLRKRVQHDAIDLDDEAVLELIAERVATNIRALEGALIRVVAFASLTGRSLSAPLAAEVLDELYPAGTPAPGT